MSTMQPTTAPVTPQPKPDPETVTISGYEVRELYGPPEAKATSPDNPLMPHERIGVPGGWSAAPFSVASP